MKKKIVKIFKLVTISVLLLNIFAPAMLAHAVMEDVSSTIFLHVDGANLEYDIDSGGAEHAASNISFRINNADSSYDLTSGQVDFYEYEGNISGFYSSYSYNYNYTKDGNTVTFNFSTSWDDLITSLKINDVEYISQVPTTKDDLVDAFDKETRHILFDVANIPYASDYTVVVTGTKQSEQFMGNFLWTYDKNGSLSEDDKIPHGKLEFVSAEYNGTTYNTVAEVNAAGNIYQWEDGIKKDSYESNDNTGMGEAMFPTGTELTLKLIPDAGYQLTSLDLNGQPFEAGTAVGTYTFTITGGNFHLGASFTETENVVKNSSESVQSGNIEIDLTGEAAFTHGTAKLEVSDADPDTKDDFEAELPEGYTVDDYLDISLYNSIYKGVDNSETSWDSEVDELEHDATVTLKLSDDMDGKDIKVIHEAHDGSTVTGYDVIDATYDTETNSISFATDGFSNYAIISKASDGSADDNDEYSITDAKGNSISFNEQGGHTYTFSIIDYMSLTDAELASLGIDRDSYNVMFIGIKDATKEYGEIVKIYEMNVIDEDDNYLHDGPFTIKLKMTEDMKEFNAFKIIYVDVDDDFASETPIDLEVEDGYLTGTLQHLSVYTIVGYNKTTANNPQTGDNLVNNLALGAISLMSLIGAGLYLHKVKQNG